jgi:hypothetical protein
MWNDAHVFTSAVKHAVFIAEALSARFDLDHGNRLARTIVPGAIEDFGAARIPNGITTILTGRA